MDGGEATRTVVHAATIRNAADTAEELVVARVGGVRATGKTTLPWVVTDAAECPITPISQFLRDFVACGNSAASCRSYGYDLLRWWRFLAAVEVPWNRAERGQVRDFVLWLRAAHNPARDRRRSDAAVSGSVNPRTGKQYLSLGYAVGDDQSRPISYVESCCS
jgi:integrase/recombinase XerC